MKIETREGLQKALAINIHAQERVKRELDRVAYDNPPILGPDGKPTMESLDRMDQEALRLLDSWLQAPTMTEQSLLSSLGDNSTEGTSLCVTILTSLMMFQAVQNIAPMVASVAPAIFSHYLAFVSQQGRVDKESFNLLVNEVVAHLNLKATDNEGHDILMGEELEKEKLAQAQAVLGWYITQSEHLGLITVDHEANSFQFSEKGMRLMKHYMAANQWVKDIQEAHQNLNRSPLEP
jgi:hypothetical protein